MRMSAKTTCMIITEKWKLRGINVLVRDHENNMNQGKIVLSLFPKVDVLINFPTCTGLQKP